MSTPNATCAGLALAVALCATAITPVSFGQPAKPDGAETGPAAGRAREHRAAEVEVERRRPRLGRDAPTTIRAEFVTAEGPLRLSVEDGVIAATLNGEPMDLARIRDDTDAWVVLGSTGEPWLRLDPRAMSAGRAVMLPGDRARRVIGVVTNPVGGALAAQQGLEPGSALVVESVIPGGPAERAGIRRHDVIRAIDGRTPATVERLRGAIEVAGEGAPVRLAVMRRGQALIVDVAPDAPPDAESRSFAFRLLSPEVMFVPEGDRLFAAGTPPHLPREIEERLRTEAMRALSTSDALSMAQDRLERLTGAARLDEQQQVELARTLRASAEALRAMEFTFTTDINLPEVRIVESGDQDVALFPRGPAGASAHRAPTKKNPAERPHAPRATAALAHTAGSMPLADRLERVERRLERLEALLTRLVERRAAENQPDP